MKMIFNSQTNETNFHKEGFEVSLVLKVFERFGTQE